MGPCASEGAPICVPWKMSWGIHYVVNTVRRRLEVGSHRREIRREKPSDEMKEDKHKNPSVSTKSSCTLKRLRQGKCLPPMHV
jgi:hypothetical protein